ncbi:1-phosphofructokinase family hexose kinase [Caenispirillum salinarum]|uniref:1-phosphofructokinase family hexose kinase n=1 Tax=Caenispirillum salinarum TaxID=859058 RepID=UPI00384FCD06
MGGILTLTLNPALDVNASVDRLEPDRKLRTDAPRMDPGGGGINVARVATRLGADVTAWALLGGPTGQMLADLLEGEGVRLVRCETDGATRLSFKVRVTEEDDAQYRFVPPGPEVDAAQADAILRSIDECMKGVDWVVLSGSLPPGLGPDFIGRITELVRGRGARLILDTSGPALEAGLEAGVWLVKPDRHETQDLAGEDLPDDDALAAYARRMIERGAAQVVIATLGAEGALVVTADAAMRLRPPDVKQVSAVGAGDSFVAALVAALADGRAVEDAARAGVAAAAAAVTTTDTRLARAEDIERLTADVTSCEV